MDVLQDGKQTLALNIKNPNAQQIVRKLCQKSDVLIDPYRPGVLEKLGLGPDILLKDNPRLIYARLTGFGQTGPLASRAGHDINYVAVSGILSLLGRKNQPPTPPVNILADMAGGGLLCAFGICTALLERTKSNRGQVIDSSMTEGAAYVASWLTRSQDLFVWGNERGCNVLDSNAFYYDTYKTKDGKYMSVGALEPQFFSEFIKGLGLDNVVDQSSDNDIAKEKVTNAFRTKTQEEWTKIFENIDACVFPVVDWKLASEHPQNKYRKSFVDKTLTNETVVPVPAPVLQRTPAISATQKFKKWSRSDIEGLLSGIGIDKEEIHRLEKEGALSLPVQSKL